MVYNTTMPPNISIANLTKTYSSGLTTLARIDLDIRRGEIFALLGRNGAGKTALVNSICGTRTLILLSGAFHIDMHAGGCGADAASRLPVQ